MNKVRKYLAIGALLAFGAASPWLVRAAYAAVTANSIITAQTPNRGVVQFLQGTDVALTYKTVYTAGANGSKCFGMWATNLDGSASHLLTVQIVNTAIKYGGAAVTLASNSGFATAVPAVNVMSSTNWPGLPADGNGNPFFYMASGDTLQATFATAFTVVAGNNIGVVAVCVDF